MLRAEYRRYLLHFKEPAITSRSTMRSKETFFIKIYDDADPSRFGIGECALFRGLSAEDTPDYEACLAEFCRNFDGTGELPAISSIRFGVESALADMAYRSGAIPTDALSFKINGLIWMGDKPSMYRRICDKLSAGFSCVKLKIGGINFEEELDLLNFIRSNFSASELELRLDANGAFSTDNALGNLERLSRFDIHSIEQPVKPRQWEAFADIIRRSPIPVALDEELIGCVSDTERNLLLDVLNPHYIILKPSLCGGFRAAEKWIASAVQRGIGWWATSALESNAGLTAIARWLSRYNVTLPQGLGTGALYTDNLPSVLEIKGEYLTVGADANVPTAGFVNTFFSETQNI